MTDERNIFATILINNNKFLLMPYKYRIYLFKDKTRRQEQHSSLLG